MESEIGDTINYLKNEGVSIAEVAFPNGVDACHGGQTIQTDSNDVYCIVSIILVET